MNKGKIAGFALKGAKVVGEAIIGALIARIAGEVADVAVEKGKEVVKKPIYKSKKMSDK